MHTTVPLRILIVDDHQAVRRGVRALLSSRSDWFVCGEAEDGMEAVEKVNELQADIVLMDISMPRMNGLEATREVMRGRPETKVLIVSQHDSPGMVREAVRAGARGYILKSHLSSDLVPAIESMYTGEPVFSSPIQASADTAAVIEEPSSAITDFIDHDDLDMLAGGGEMGALMRAKDWAATPFGAISKWPQSLRTAVRICLDSRFPIVLWWGPELRLLYNDAWRPTLGTTKHPWGLGAPGKEVWPEIWNIIGPMLESVLDSGKATWEDDQLLMLERHGYLEESYWTYSYSAIRLASGDVGGVFSAVHETTQRVLGDRRLRTLREVADQTTIATSVQQACALVIETISKNPHDLPFAFLYQSVGDGHDLACSTFASDQKHQKLTSDEEIAWGIQTAKRTLQPQTISRLDFVDHLPRSKYGGVPNKAVTFPLFVNRDQGLLGTLTLGVNPHRELDTDYINFLEGLAANVASNINNARAYEQEKQRAEALAEIDRAKTLFFSNVSHEFRTPLTLMLGPLEETLHTTEGLAPEHRQRLEVAHRNSMRLLKLVNTLLDFSRIEAGRAQPQFRKTDLSSFTAELASVFRSLMEKAGLKYIVDCPPLPEPVFIDRDMWEKVVFNLLSNAFKFTPSGDVRVSVRSEDRQAILSVRDSGSGIPSWELPNIFKRFHRVQGAQGRTHEGTGIGLALAQELVKLHGGTTEVKSKLGVGTEFRVHIPFGEKHLPSVNPGSPSQQVSTALRGETFVEEALTWLPKEAQAIVREEHETLGAPATDSNARPRILLAEDNADMSDYVRRLLAHSYEVEAVANGAAAFEAAKGSAPDLILSDVMMPGMDGLELVEKVRARKELKLVPIILLSARAGEEARIQGMSQGADDYLTKPFSARELLARVRTHLQLAQLRKESAKALYQNEELLRLAQHIAGIGSFELNIKTGLNRWNPELESLYGLASGEFLGTQDAWLQLVHREDRLQVLSCIEQAMKDGLFEGEWRVIWPDDSVHWVLGRARVLKDQHGNPERLIGVNLDITERKRAEEILDESRERLGFVREATGVGIWFCDLPFNDLIWDQRVKEHFWLPPDAKVTIETFYQRLHPADREPTRLAMERAIVNNTRYDVEYRTVSPEGHEKWIRAIGGVSYDPAGQPRRFDGITLDVSDHKAVEESLRLSRENLEAELAATKHLQEISTQLISDNKVDLLYNRILDAASVIMRADCASLQIFHPAQGTDGELELLAHRGFHPRSASSWRWVRPTSNSTCGMALRMRTRVIVPDVNQCDFMHASEDLATYLANGIQSVQSTPLISRSGQFLGMISTHWLEPHVPSEQDLRFFDVLARQAADTIERKQGDTRMREQQQQYEALVRTSAQIVWTASPDGAVNEESLTWNEFTGQSFEQFKGLGGLDVIHHEDRDRVRKEWEKSVSEKSLFEIEYRLLRKDGEWRWMFARGVPIFEAEGRIRKWVGMSTDITERKNAESKISDLVEHLEERVKERTLELAQTSQQMRDLSTRLLQAQDEERRRIARELHDSAGQVLTVLLMNIASIAQQAKLQDLPDLSRVIEDTESLAQQLSREIRTMSYLLHPPLLEENGLSEALRWYIRGLKERSGLEITLQVSADLGRLPREQELAIFRLIQESLTNVHRHSGSNKASLTVVKESDKLVVEVEDQGKGISPARLLEIQKEGSGVGIRGMRERIRYFGGHMNIESSGCGTKIRVVFPAWTATLSENVEPAENLPDIQTQIEAAG